MGTNEGVRQLEEEGVCIREEAADSQQTFSSWEISSPQTDVELVLNLRVNVPDQLHCGRQTAV